MVAHMKHILKKISLSDGIDLIISKPSLEDAASIVAFLNKVGGETEFLTFGLNEFPFSAHEEELTIKDCLERDICLMLIAQVGDEIVSQLFLQRSDKPRLMHIGDVAITVSKNYWGKSIGGHMMQIALEWAKNKNLSKMQLQVRTDNARAVKLYEKLGFRIEGTITQAMKVNDKYFDDYIMGLLLD
jgi:RimJ/RimL family protein N-acetyltransferase